MTESELIKKIQELKDIKPSQNWVISCKNRILEEGRLDAAVSDTDRHKVSTISEFFRFIRFTADYRPTLKPALVAMACFGVIIGLFGFTQNTVPGDLLYPAQKVMEITRVTFSDQEHKSIVHLKFANKRLEDLKKIAENNNVRNLAPTLKEFQANLSDAVNDLAGINANVTSSDPTIIKGLVQQTQELEKNIQKAKSLGIVFDGSEEEEWEKAKADLVGREIEDLETRIEGEEGESLLEEIKALYQNKDYTGALEKILLFTY